MASQAARTSFITMNCSSPVKIVVRVSGEEEITLANLGTRTSEHGRKELGVR